VVPVEEINKEKRPEKPRSKRYVKGEQERVVGRRKPKERGDLAPGDQERGVPHKRRKIENLTVQVPSARAPARKIRKKPVKKAPVSKPPVEPEVSQAEVEQGPKQLEIAEVIMVKELAEKMNVPSAKVIQHLMTMGIMANVNQVLETKAAMSIAEHFGFEVKAISADDEAGLQEETVDETMLKPRPPVVTIMGHVDHGKTTLLDAIRESKITDTEFGGITQHIGAYSVEIGGQNIVFLDTPGHEAFTAMRARGARVTDEVILVVAADDGVMPQTIEAIDHARAAKVPIVIAINKIDLPGANPDRVMQELSKYGLTPEEWGGETICVKVSAKARTNLDELLEMILLQAEMLELKADPDRSARGIIVEALLDKGRGPVATVLVHSGTLQVGDPFVVGIHHGRVRAMLDDRGKRVTKAGPATPVEVLGLTGVPVAGDSFVVVENERRARQIAESRQEEQQKTEFSKTAKITLEELHQHIREGETQELRIVIKADVHGSVEALSSALERLSTEQVRLQVIHGGVGAINESDVMLATASNAIVLGFNVRPVAKARDMAEKEQIDVRLYNVIYQAIDDIKKAMEGLLEPTFKEVPIGQAQVLALFSLPKGGTVAGCRITSGKVIRNALVRVLRDNQEVFKGNVASLRRAKDDVREVLSGYECGIRLENYNDIQVDDVIEAYTLEKLTMTLEGTVAR
jgi:translation initiation factor IF-2